MSDQELISAFIRERGITRCPTACAAATATTVAESDRLALRRHAEALEATRKSSTRWMERPAS
jgi:hypothetical protein